MGFYAKKSSATDVGIKTGGKFTASNCVFGVFSGATIVAMENNNTEDCCANDRDIFAPGVTFSYHSNLKSDTLPGRRLYCEQTSFHSIYIENEAGKSAYYDNVLVTGMEGDAYGKTHLSLDHIEANSVSFNSITAGTQKSVDLTAAGATYTVQASDPSIIVFSPGAEDKTVTLPAAAGATCKIRYFVCNYTTYDAQVKFSGDIISVVAIPEPVFDAYVRTAIFIDALGKWAL